MVLRIAESEIPRIARRSFRINQEIVPFHKGIHYIFWNSDISSSCMQLMLVIFLDPAEENQARANFFSRLLAVISSWAAS